ncbi:MAG: U32 family peptidase [Clostridia bacterium]
MNRVELLAPAGNAERLNTAFRFGADAVYLGLPTMSLRNFADNFTFFELDDCTKKAHAVNKRVYVTCNAFARDKDIAALPDMFRELERISVDAIIVNDPGVIRVANRVLKHTPLHLSTQANTQNTEAALFWSDFGVTRIILARELSLDEIRAMRDKLPPDIELEAFIHGAMCVSYSGRCLLSNYLDGRDGNRGECIQPCRWSYEIRERGKDGEYLPIEQDSRGTYILNSRDMNMLSILDKVIEAGVSSLKIEGRMKSVFYVATVVNAYRMALDTYYKNIEHGVPYAPNEKIAAELFKASHRPFCTGFSFKNTELQAPFSTKYISEYEFSAIVIEYDAINKTALIEQRNRFFNRDVLSILSPNDVSREFIVNGIANIDGETMDVAPHPQERLIIGCDEPLKTGDILRKQKVAEE